MVRIDWDDRGMNEVLRSPEMRGAIEEAAQAALRYAQAVAPVGDPREGDEHPGHYKRNLKVENAVYIARRGPRPCKEVVADVPYAEPVEDRHHVIGQTLAFLAASGLSIRRDIE